jgi:hypothetical protein
LCSHSESVTNANFHKVTLAITSAVSFVFDRNGE